MEEEKKHKSLTLKIPFLPGRTGPCPCDHCTCNPIPRVPAPSTLTLAACLVALLRIEIQSTLTISTLSPLSAEQRFKIMVRLKRVVCLTRLTSLVAGGGGGMTCVSAGVKHAASYTRLVNDSLPFSPSLDLPPPPPPPPV